MINPLDHCINEVKGQSHQAIRELTQITITLVTPDIGWPGNVTNIVADAKQVPGHQQPPCWLNHDYTITCVLLLDRDIMPQALTKQCSRQVGNLLGCVFMGGFAFSHSWFSVILTLHMHTHTLTANAHPSGFIPITIVPKQPVRCLITYKTTYNTKILEHDLVLTLKDDYALWLAFTIDWALKQVRSTVSMTVTF